MARTGHKRSFTDAVVEVGWEGGAHLRLDGAASEKMKVPLAHDVRAC